MVCAHLTAVHRIFEAHALLDESMPGIALYGLTAESRHDINRVPGQARVVHDAGGSLLFQEGFRQQSHEVVTLDKFTLLVVEKAAVEIPVPA